MLQLSTIAAHLESLEESIIFKILDRAQFKCNSFIYTKGNNHFKQDTKEYSLFDLRLKYQEEMDAVFGRFTVPEERPFYRNLPAPLREITAPISELCIKDFDCVNVSTDIKRYYEQLIPNVCSAGDDQQYGSSIEHDVIAYQAIARRIHYGALYVAEAKYQSSPKEYQKFIDMKDSKSLLKLLTRQEVEIQILHRIKAKVSQIQQTVKSDLRITVSPNEILSFFEQCIIPTTKKGEILYLLNRTKG